MYVDNRKKDLLNLCKGSADELNDTTIALEAEYSIYFREKQKKFCTLQRKQQLFIFQYSKNLSIEGYRESLFFDKVIRCS